MEPFYFGKAPGKLFGIYYPPEMRSARDSGVVLCYPVGQEYIRSHRSFLRLALMLSTEGFHVLRFDYFGCGDSAGNSDDMELRLCIEDIGTAVEELKGGSGISRVCLVGLRLGGSLSVMCGAKRGDVSGMVLWEPIVDGKAHVGELRDLHADWLRGSFAKEVTEPRGKRQLEVLGFALSDSLVKEIAGLNLLSIQSKPADEVLIVENGSTCRIEPLRDHLEALGSVAVLEHIPAPDVWIKKDDEMSKGLVPVEVLARIVAWVSESFA